MIRRYSTFSRTSLPIPPEEIRLNPNPKVPWSVFSQEHKSVLQVNYLVVNEILSHSQPTELDNLFMILKVNYLIPTPLINAFMKFMEITETTGIEFAEPIKDTIRKPHLYLRPADKLTTVLGAYCLWQPHLR